ncbi:MAG TPA: transglycosylase SLT domain-containing protein [Spirochaetia bacterium]|nr:transglycosylase SLT domain-containing protein [Spirochaetia bacterium]
MKGKYLLLVTMVIFVAVWLISIKVANNKKGQELISPTVTITPTSVPIASSSAANVFFDASMSAILATSSTLLATTASEILSSKPKPTPTTVMPTPTPTPETSEAVNGFIERFAAQFGVDKNVLRHIALCESGFNSRATNGPYAGLYQFGSVTWQNIRKEIGEDTNPDLRYSAKDAVQTAAYAVSKGRGGMWPNCFP